MNELYDTLITITDPSNVKIDEPMKDHTTMKVGGCADVFVMPQTIGEATEIVRLLLSRKEQFAVIGNGSNLIVSDKGYKGCIVCMACDGITMEGTTITVQAGAMLSKVAKTAYDNGLTGLEFASGIPGSVGGAVVMNAGAYGGQMEDVITKVTLLDHESGNVITLPCDKMGFGYRTSIVKTGRYTVLEAVFELQKGDKTKIKEMMDDLAVRRREKQPLEYPSAGSTFKRPEGYFAGKLIEDAGLKGYASGGAQVSEKHCGFVINKGGATATDVLDLIRDVRKRVFESSSVMLEPEVVILGEDIGS